MVGTAISVAAILCAAYALSRKDLFGRTFFMLLFIITMFIDGGLIARYLVVRDLGMLDTIWAVVLPGAIGVWNLIIARAFFENNMPAELREAAQLDGANDFRFFLQIVLPLSKPLIFLMIMIHLVANWNAFFDALIFLNDESKYPLQLVLRNVLIQSEVSAAGGTGATRLLCRRAAHGRADQVRNDRRLERPAPDRSPLHAEALHQGRPPRRREELTVPAPLRPPIPPHKEGTP